MALLKTTNFFVIAIFIGFSGVANAASNFEQIVNQTTPKLSGNELKKLQKDLIGSWINGRTRVDFINEKYYYPHKSQLKAKGKKRLPKYPLVKWQLEIGGKIPVNDQSMSEIDDYKIKLQKEINDENKELKLLRKKHKKSSKEERKKLNSILIKKAVQLGQKKSSMRSLDLIKAVIPEARKQSIEKLSVGVVRTKSNVQIEYHKPKQKIKNLDQIEQEIEINVPIMIFDGGFYMLSGNKKRPEFRKFDRLKNHYKWNQNSKINEAYEFWNKRCSILRKHRKELKQKATYQDCIDKRDQFLQLGAIKRSDYLFVNEADVRKTTQAESDLYFQPTAKNAQKASTWPVLDYYCADDYQLYYEDLKARKFANTLWFVQRNPRYTDIARNWSKDEHYQYRVSSGVGMHVHLREDGIVGINNIYDSRHRWSANDIEIQLDFFDGALKLSIPVASANNQSINNIKAHDDILYTYAAELVLGYQHNLASRIRHDTNYLNSLKINYVPPRKKTNACKTIKANAPQTNKTSTVTKKTITKPVNDQAKLQQSNKPPIKVDYAHISIKTVNENTKIDPAIKAIFSKGFFLEFKPDGTLGFNADDPGPYFFFPVNKWVKTSNGLKIILDKNSYSFVLPGKGTDLSKNLQTLDNESKSFRMTLIVKNKGQR